MNLEQIIDEVQLIVQDDSFFTDEEKILARVNGAVLWACSQPGVEIPSLKGLGSFVTVEGQANALIEGVSPSFTGRVLRAGKPGTKLYNALEDLYDDFYPLDKVGAVEAVCVQRNEVWYQGIPETPETVLMVLQRDPALLADDEDVPVEIPEFLHMDLVVHGTVCRIYEMIEDGVDGEQGKVNTINSYMHRKEGLQKFREWLGSRRQHTKTSHWRY